MPFTNLQAARQPGENRVATPDRSARFSFGGDGLKDTFEGRFRGFGVASLWANKKYGSLLSVPHDVMYT